MEHKLALNKVRERRIEMGLTQAELAETAGVSRTTIWGLERGTLDVTTTKTLERLADALTVQISELFYT